MHLNLGHISLAMKPATSKIIHEHLQTSYFKLFSCDCAVALPYLPNVEDCTWYITEEKHVNNQYEHPSNILVPSLPQRNPSIFHGGKLDLTVGQAIEDEEEKEGNESHH